MRYVLFHGFMFCNVPCLFFLFCVCLVWGNTTGDERGNRDTGYTYLSIDLWCLLLFSFPVQDDVRKLVLLCIVREDHVGQVLSISQFTKGGITEISRGTHDAGPG